MQARRQVEAVHFHPGIKPGQMKRQPDDIHNHELQRGLDRETGRIEGKAAEQRGIHRIGLGVDELQCQAG